MKFEKTLIKGKLVKRYKRFFVDFKVNNKLLTAHCPNTGSMLGLLKKNSYVWVSENNNPKRKLKYTLELIKVKKSLVGINTHRANKIIYEALKDKKIKEIGNYDEIKPEAVYEDKTRFDFLLLKKNKRIFLEIKNVTLSSQPGIAEFPDAVTERGNKHLKKLLEAKNKGFESYILFLVQREKINKFKIAKNIDPEYFETYKKVKKLGVKMLCYGCTLSSKEIKVKNPIKII